MVTGTDVLSTVIVVHVCAEMRTEPWEYLLEFWEHVWVRNYLGIYKKKKKWLEQSKQEWGRGREGLLVWED